MIRKTLSAIVLSSAIGFSGCSDSDAKTDSNEFPSERILTVSARDYCEAVGKNIVDYDLKGLFWQEKLIEEFIPSGTEVIVDYRPGAFGGRYGAGTALIPKKK